MLPEVQKYIDHVSPLWLKEPQAEVAQYSDYLLDQFTTDEQVSAFVSGIIRMALITEDPVYKQMATYFFNTSIEQNISPLSLLPIKYPPDKQGSLSLQLSIDKAGQVSRSYRAQDRKVGFTHGHYRLLTPGNLANIVLVSSKCDILLLGLERGRRTLKYKGVLPIYKDWQRARIMLGSGLADYLVWISRLECSNAGYRRMVKTIKPDVYFGNATDPNWLKQEMRQRAEDVQVEYFEIKGIESFSSTDFLQGNVHIPNLAG